MNIAIFTDSFFPSMGGTERAVYGLANELAKEHNVAVFCPNVKNAVDDYDFAVVRAPSIAVTKNDYLAFPNLSNKFKKFLDKFKPDVIHCQSASSIAEYGVKYGEKNNIPLVFTVHTKFRTAFSQSIKSKMIVNSLIKNLAKKLNKATKVCTVSNDMIKELSEYGCKKDVEVVRNGMVFEKNSISETIKGLAKNQYNISERDYNLLFVGRIEKLKNINLIFDSLIYLKKNNIPFKMFFVGSGSDKKYFEKLTIDLGLFDNIVFTGKVDDDMLKSLYCNADLFIFPSIFDNDPLVVVESALCKTPALTLEGTGSSERIDNNHTGFVVKQEEFKKKVAELSKNKELLRECGNLAYEKIPKSWENVAKDYEEIYKKLIQAKDKVENV